ncbi:hypothetical protein KO500_06955 [Cellulophaga baltica]|uniref:DUF6146 family protein n=1 Tax=Cellulophaga TaxID=104264 RepID=UPI001C06A21C|nr:MULTISPECIES: DUF6146 family protein [Cellulophaga]MBU2996165.1 hypothetical protein [Cellulophaga baltica]MDO6767560.1 DUF6146 family protein [Cellulophaga sp. 1_MG-2023]
MKKRILQVITALILIASLAYSCNTSKTAISINDTEKEAFTKTEGDTITINDEESEYEIIIIEPGFNFWLQSVAHSQGYYTQSYLENRNAIWVTEWNQRVLQFNRYDPNLYEMRINYSQGIDYGYEVNYKLYNYFIYFQRKYNQRLGTFIPRI